MKYPIGVDVQENIVLANYGHHEIIVMNISGKLIWRKKLSFKGIKLHRPYGVEVRNGYIYASFNKEGIVAKISLKDGKVIKTVGPFLKDGTKMNNIQGLSIDMEGNIYLVDTGRVVIFDKDLETLAVAIDKEIQVIRGIDINKKTNEILLTGFPSGDKITGENQSGAWLFNPITDKF